MSLYNKKVAGSIPRPLGLSEWSFHVPHVSAGWVLARFSCLLPQFEDMHIRLIGNSKLAVSANSYLPRR